MTSPVGNPPGWYQDPWQPNMQRYWDGTAWTPHQTWNAAAPLPPGPGGPAMAPAYVGPAYAATGPLAPSGQPVAEWWRRLLGWIVDSIVMIPLYIPLAFLLVPQIVSSPSWNEFIRLAESSDSTSQLEAQQRLTELLTQDLTGWVLLATLYGLVVSTAYFTIGLGRWGRTVGGKALGIRAVTAAGQIPGYERAFKRYLPLAGCSLLGLVPVVGALGNLLLLLIFVSMFFNPQRQAWHDLLAGTYVVRD